jgi:hypothetical protein
MTQYKCMGIDTPEVVFTLHGIDCEDGPILRVNLRRVQMASFFGRTHDRCHTDVRFSRR